MPAKSLNLLVLNAHKNAVCVQGISWEDAAKVKEAEKIGGQQASPELLLEVLIEEKQPWPTLSD